MLAWGSKTFVMGIVNVTPDSFSGDGRIAIDSAVEHAVAQHALGADILDIGGESTRPGSQPISAEVECARILPVIRAVHERLPHARISVDTYKPEVALEACKAGASMVNSVWGAPDALLEIVRAMHAGIVIMHNRSRPLDGANAVDDVIDFLREASDRALRCGIPRKDIVLDPGIGFGKTPDQNISVLAHLAQIVDLAFPTLLGTSRKSTLGLLTGRREPSERVAATTATTAFAVMAKMDIVRVHDVAAACDAVAIGDAIVRGWRPQTWIASQ